MEKGFISTVKTELLAKKVTDYQCDALGKIIPSELHRVVLEYNNDNRDDNWWDSYSRVAGPIVEPDRFCSYDDYEVMDVFHDVYEMLESDSSNYVNNMINFWRGAGESNPMWDDILKLIKIINVEGY